MSRRSKELPVPVDRRRVEKSSRTVTFFNFYSRRLSRFVSGLAMNAIPGARDTARHRQPFFLQGDTCELPGRTPGKSTPTRYERYWTLGVGISNYNAMRLV